MLLCGENWRRQTIRDRLRTMTLLLVLGALVAGGCAPLPTNEPIPEPTRPQAVPEPGSTTSDLVQAPDPGPGRDAALAYVSQRYGRELPGEPGWNENVTETAAPMGERETPPKVPAEDLRALETGNRAFALDLYQALRGKEGNLFFSPYSISTALAMTYAGARGGTADEMAGTLHFTLPQGRLHSAFNMLDLELARRGEGAMGRDDGGFRLHVSNALWGQAGYSFLPEFVEVLAGVYDAGLRQADFAAEAEGARRTINDWVSEQMEGRIGGLIPQGVLDAATRLVLTNTIYFNAAWAKPFEESATQDGTFQRLDGSRVSVPLMRQTEALGYARGQGYQAVELPYQAEELSMVVLLPDDGQFEAFEAALDAATVDAILTETAYRELDLTMPRFNLESEFSLAETLQDMGMSLPFSERADFSGMTGRRDLFIGAVLHKAFVAVDEEGTEAAAATAVAMKLSAMPGEPLQVRVDRPFIFFVRDIPTGCILFVGRVLDPSGG